MKPYAYTLDFVDCCEFRAAPDADSPAKMSPADIRAAISEAGTSQAAIAQFLCVSSGSVGRVINGTMRSRRIEAELQKITGKPMRGPIGKPGRKKTVWNGRIEVQA